MPIAFLRSGEKGIIGRVKGPPALRQYLETLGFVRGEEVRVIQSSGESIVLRIKGSRIALSKEMARRIWIVDQHNGHDNKGSKNRGQ
jgi:ferrous iron transport protein A